MALPVHICSILVGLDRSKILRNSVQTTISRSIPVHPGIKKKKLCADPIIADYTYSKAYTAFAVSFGLAKNRLRRIKLILTFLPASPESKYRTPAATAMCGAIERM